MNSPASSSLPREEKLARHAPEAAAIEAVFKRLESDLSVSEAVEFIVNVTLSSSRGPCVRSHVPSASSDDVASTTHPAPVQPRPKKKRVRSVAKRAERCLRRADFLRQRAGMMQKPPEGKQNPMPVSQPAAVEKPLEAEAASPPPAAEPVAPTDDSPLESALALSAREFASPPRGAPLGAITRVTTPLRAEFSASSSRLRQISYSPQSLQPPPPSPGGQRRREAIDFVQRHVRTQSRALSPAALEGILVELEKLDPRDWKSHLVAAGGTYTPKSSPPLKRPAGS